VLGMKGGRVSNPIRETNDEFHGRIPVEMWVESLVEQLVQTFGGESKILRAEIAEVRTELREAREQARRWEEELMATLADEQAADKRYQDAVAVRDAREKATITAQEGQISTQEGQIAALEASEVPDDVVQKKNDLAAQIEAENKAAEAAAAGGQGSSAGATAGTSGQGAPTVATV